MTSSFIQSLKSLNGFRWLLFATGGLVLAILWWAIFISEGFFAESHLASYYCCLTPEELQKIDLLDRLVSDFFRTSPGREVPALLFVAVSGLLFVSALRQAANPAAVLFAFGLLSLGYLVADYVLTGLSWSVSHIIVGPQLTAYKGYGRTWYGIVAHAALWAAFFYAVLKLNRTTLNARL